jgi:hypothetical protein
MQFNQNLIILFFLFGTLSACQPSNQNVNEAGEDILKTHEVQGKIKNIKTEYQDTIYVPVYSDIYSQSRDQRFLLTATLSIRNTSMTDSIYLKAINYYDTGGDLVRRYTEKTLFLKPLESIDYVVDEEDKSGGAGANFIIVWGAKSDKIKPIFEAVMISTRGQQGISFISEGVSISRK